MKITITLLVFILSLFNPNNISKINKLKKEAEKKFLEKDYKSAIKKYKYLLDSMDLKDEKISLNLSHSYLLDGDTIQAIEGYNSLFSSNKNDVKSIAYQQLGVISNEHNKLKESSEDSYKFFTKFLISISSVFFTKSHSKIYLNFYI